MSEEKDYMVLWRKRQESLAQQVTEANKELFALMDLYGVSKITIIFDGSGDSGDLAIGSLIAGDTYYKNEGVYQPVQNEDGFPETVVDVGALFPTAGTVYYSEFSEQEGWVEKTGKKEMGIACLAQDIASRILGLRYGGWEINEGAHGKIVFYPSRVVVDFNERVMTENNSVTELHY
jgi:hypothetical protein